MTIHKVLKASSEKHKQFDTILQLRNKMKMIKNRCKIGETETDKKQNR